MTLPAIGLMTLAALIAWLFPARRGALLIFSLIALFALQLDAPGTGRAVFLLPFATLALIGGVWFLVMSRADSTEPTPPERAEAERASRARLALAFVVLIIVLFAILKLPELQSAAASALALTPAWSWLGFSYIAFRLMHVLLDYRIGRVTPMTLPDFALYVIFFPALTAGPIARVEQFKKELDAPHQPDSTRLISGFSRIGQGLFKKFVLADSLAYFALNPALVAASPGDTLGGALAYWAMLYAYAFRIFFDFSGYVDIAIGIGRLAGINLPENFNAPYARTNITAFWNNWHITLSSWFRAYFFMPLSRTLLGTPIGRSRLAVIFIAQVATMVLIGLWHGAALNFILWGAWHGVGLWAHKVLVDRTRGWTEYVAARPALSRVVSVLGLLATFHFVALGWIFFALPDAALIGKTFAALVGRG